MSGPISLICAAVVFGFGALPALAQNRGGQSTTCERPANAVVAENFDFFAGGPEARRRALACSGVADEEIGYAVGADYAGAVEFDGSLLG